MWYDQCSHAVRRLSVTWYIMATLCSFIGMLLSSLFRVSQKYLIHQCRMTHRLIIRSDDGLLPGRRQVFFGTYAGSLLIWPLGTEFDEILIEIYKFQLKKMHLLMSDKWLLYCIGISVLIWVVADLQSTISILFPVSLQYANPYLWWPKRIWFFEMIGTIFNTLRPRQNGRHFPGSILNCICLNENVRISKKISLKFVPMDQRKNIPTLLQIMAWRRPGDKPLSEPMMV